MRAEFSPTISLLTCSCAYSLGPRTNDRLANDGPKRLSPDHSSALMTESSVEDGRKRKTPPSKATTASSMITTSPIITREPTPIATFALDQSSLGSAAQRTMNEEEDCLDTSHLTKTQCGSGNTCQTHSPPQTQHGLLSPSWQGEEPIKTSQDLILDCLRFQNQLISRLNAQHDPVCFGENSYGQASEEVPSSKCRPFAMPSFIY